MTEKFRFRNLQYFFFAPAWTSLFLDRGKSSRYEIVISPEGPRGIFQPGRFKGGAVDGSEIRRTTWDVLIAMVKKLLKPQLVSKHRISGCHQRCKNQMFSSEKNG